DNWASVLAGVPRRQAADLVAPTSWSCPHGIERWRSNCGCRVQAGTSQQWRRPLRTALEWLAERLDARMKDEAPRLFASPEAARDHFGSVAALSQSARREFTAAHLRVSGDLGRGVRLLDAGVARLGMFGSCASFFDDVP